MLFTNSCRCSVGGETIRLSSQSSRFRYPYSAPLFFFSFFFFAFLFLHGRWCSMYVCFFFFLQHTPPVITTCSWGSVGHFRPWTHTSDDSYIYQLSLVVATATVSFVAQSRHTNAQKLLTTVTRVLLCEFLCKRQLHCCLLFYGSTGYRTLTAVRSIKCRE